MFARVGMTDAGSVRGPSPCAGPGGGASRPPSLIPCPRRAVPGPLPLAGLAGLASPADQRGPARPGSAAGAAAAAAWCRASLALRRVGRCATVEVVRCAYCTGPGDTLKSIAAAYHSSWLQARDSPLVPVSLLSPPATRVARVA